MRREKRRDEEGEEWHKRIDKTRRQKEINGEILKREKSSTWKMLPRIDGYIRKITLKLNFLKESLYC